MREDKIQSEFYDLENGINYHRQYWSTTTLKKLPIENWIAINEFLDEVTDRLSEGQIVSIKMENE
jgi:hypothetical protein